MTDLLARLARAPRSTARPAAPRPSAPRRTVWLDPGPHGASGELVEALSAAARLVVVPRTGSRRADAAVLLDPSPALLAQVRRMLPAATVLAVPAATPGPALAASARHHDVHLLPAGTCPAVLVQWVLGRGPGVTVPPALTPPGMASHPVAS